MADLTFFNAYAAVRLNRYGSISSCDAQAVRLVINALDLATESLLLTEASASIG